MAKIATLHEIESYWSIDDLADANEALDVKFEAEQRQLDEMKKEQ